MRFFEKMFAKKKDENAESSHKVIYLNQIKANDVDLYEVKNILKLQELANGFFGVPNGDIEAMKKIAMLAYAFVFRGYSFEMNSICEKKGCIRYNYHTTSGGTCYDGGCYSDEGDTNYYLTIERISQEEYDMHETESDKLKSVFFWEYRGTLPYEDTTEIFSLNKSLYMKNVLGLSLCLKLSKN